MVRDNAFASEDPSSSSSLEFAMDPYSPQARSITESLGISLEKHKQLCKHAELVVEWNDRLNLISRKDCNVNVVFGRHILPSLALAALPDFPLAAKDDEMMQNPTARIVDVGTGGGFPGVPLAIIYPESEFLLVDSVGKKLKAIEEMAKELGLNNIKTHHGRAEEIVDDPLQGRQYKNSFDICVGRSVTAMPRFCFWIQDLLKKDKKQADVSFEGGGRLVYIIGGDVEESVTSRLVADIAIDDLLDCKGVSDKRTLVLRASDVVKVAKESGEKKQTKGAVKKNATKGMMTIGERKNAPKGAWTKRDNSVKKQRGYENFKRFGSD
jgi:16S rRNA (guanine527-N7)-methyltransferase